jgi:hypothetical protein
VILGSDGTPTAGSQNDGRVSTEEWTLGNMVQTLLILVWSVKFPVSRLSISRCDVAFTYLRRSRKELNISPGMATIHVEHLNMRSCKCHHHWPNNAHRLQSLSWTSVKPWELHGFLREQFIGVPSVAIVRYFSFFISLNIVYIYISHYSWWYPILSHKQIRRINRHPLMVSQVFPSVRHTCNTSPWVPAPGVCWTSSHLFCWTSESYPQLVLIVRLLLIYFTHLHLSQQISLCLLIIDPHVGFSCFPLFVMKNILLHISASLLIHAVRFTAVVQLKPHWGMVSFQIWSVD